ncbi:MAG: intermembrane transport protein PqiB [Oceanicoccus sp.]
MSELQPKISSSSKHISSIWIVPIIALVLGIWMVFDTLRSEGPEIEISFKTAADLVAGKTKVKLLNVDIGQVETVTLNPDTTGVVVTVKLKKEHQDLLREDTQFWVERARIGAGGVSGLGTLLSGAYITMAPGNSETLIKTFRALEIPPLTSLQAPGIRLILESDRVASVNTGDAVFYKGYTVGRVESMNFDEASQKIRYDVFIDAPFHKLINSSVRFWNVSGISMKASAEGFRVTTEALDTILSGGITFGEPPDSPPGQPVEPEAVFRIYDNYDDTLVPNYHYGRYYVMRFDQAVSGLLPGAPVEYRGLKIGRVERLMVKELMTKHMDGAGAPIPVLVYIEPARFELEDTEEAVTTIGHVLEVGVTNGLRATLQSGNLLTGSLYINLDFYPEEKTAKLGQYEQYTTIPTISGGLKKIQQSVAQLLKKLNALPLESTVENASGALDNLDKTLASLNTILSSESIKAIPAQLNTTLKGLAPGSEAYQELNNTLYNFDKTLKNLGKLSDSLSETATLLPTPEISDPTPEAKRP